MDSRSYSHRTQGPAKDTAAPQHHLGPHTLDYQPESSARILQLQSITRYEAVLWGCSSEPAAQNSPEHCRDKQVVCDAFRALFTNSYTLQKQRRTTFCSVPSLADRN